MSDLKVGQVMEGTVTRLEKYGAFVNLGLADRRDGLIHISELAPYRVRRVEDVVKVGDQVRARVVSVDLAKGRIGLSLKDLEEGEGYGPSEAAPSEPTLTAMELAFQRAQDRRREEQQQKQNGGNRRDMGEKKKQEHEELMRRLQSSK